MLNLAWEYLRTRGELRNTVLLNELRVHRSSAVCAMLARVPSVEIASRDLDGILPRFLFRPGDLRGGGLVPLDDLPSVRLVDDVVALERLAGLVAGDLHDLRLRGASAARVGAEAPPRVVQPDPTVHLIGLSRLTPLTDCT